MVSLLERKGVGIYELNTLPEQGVDYYILKSRRSNTTTPSSVPSDTGISGTRLSSTAKNPLSPPSRNR